MGIRISEIYTSRQGEGRLTGQMSAFVRTSGCNLRCDFCDTPFTSWAPEGETMENSAIEDAIVSLDVSHVVITGGEPMLPREMVDLTRRIRELGLHITIETAGTIYRELDCDLISISPKMSNSTPSQQRAGQWADRHEQTRQSVDVVKRLVARHDYQLKFVVVNEQDIAELKDYCNQLDAVDPAKVLLMPEGIVPDELQSREQWLRPICQEQGYTFCPRMHIQWYGNQRGT